MKHISLYKTYSHSLLIAVFLFSIFNFYSCQKNEDLSNTDSKYVIESHLTDLQYGVDSVQIISDHHPVYLNVKSSEYFINSGLEEKSLNSVICIYYYKSGSAALLLSNINGNTAFAYVFNTKTKEFIEACKAYIPVKDSGILKNTDNSEEFRVVSLTNGNTLISYNGEDTTQLKKWAKCMRGAMVTLYDDWDNDPAGTFVCWATGALCVFGGAIACAF